MSSLLFRSLWPALLVIALVLVLAGPLVFIYSGTYDVAATRQHTPPVYWALITSLRQSIQAYAAREAPEPPDLNDGGLIDEGLVLYDTHCVPCHGGPGVPPGPIGLGLTPPPANLVLAGREWTSQELHWTVAKGLKMTGMPAWEFRFTDDELWAVVAFVRAMPALAPSDYEERRTRLLQPGASPREGR